MNDKIKVVDDSRVTFESILEIGGFEPLSPNDFAEWINTDDVVEYEKNKVRSYLLATKIFRLDSTGFPLKIDYLDQTRSSSNY